MVTKKQAGIGTLIVVSMAAVAGIAIDQTINPTSEMGVSEAGMSVRTATQLPLHIALSYHDLELYERTQFRIEVTNSLSQPIEGVNVSFMKPNINLITNDKGVVFFSAPYISKASAPHYIRTEYITSPGDTSYMFNLSAQKEGYIGYNGNVTVYIRE